MVDGKNLFEISELEKRYVSTRDYLSNEFALVSSASSSQPGKPFAHRFKLRLHDFQAQTLGAINARGEPETGGRDTEQTAILDHWLKERLRPESGSLS